MLVWSQESAEPLYESLSIIKLNGINKYLIARFMYKYFWHGTKIIIIL